MVARAFLPAPLNNFRKKVSVLALAFLSTVVTARAQVAREEWVRRDDLPGNYANSPKVAVDHAGNVFICSVINVPHALLLYLTRYSAADGEVAWRQIFRQRRGGIYELRGIAVDQNGDVFIGADAHRFNTGLQIFTAKFSGSAGKLLWRRDSGSRGRQEDGLGAMAIDPAGDVIVAGHAGGRGRVGFGADFFTAKYAGRDGDLKWERREQRSRGSSALTHVITDRRGNVAVTGYASAEEPSGLDLHTALYAADSGTLWWEQRRRSETTARGTVFPSGLAGDGAGNVLVAGVDMEINRHFLVKYAREDGRVLWQKAWPGAQESFSDGGPRLAVDLHDDIIVRGARFIAKYSSDGDRLWEQRDDLDTSSETHLAVDRDGNPVVGSSPVTFASGTWVQNHDFQTEKFATSDGSRLWKRRYDGPVGPAFSDDALSGLVVGPGFVVATGTTSTRFAANPTTIKYVDGPIPRTDPAVSISAQSATMHGAVNPQGFGTTVSFEYALNRHFTQPGTSPTEGVGDGEMFVPVSATIGGLQPNSVYYFRLVALANGLIARGEIRSFTTPQVSD